jgi:hypothetical protein
LVAEPVRQSQAGIHLLPEQLPTFGSHRKRPVVQISAEMTQGIADAPQIVAAPRKGRKGHGEILATTAAAHPEP